MFGARSGSLASQPPSGESSPGVTSPSLGPEDAPIDRGALEALRPGLRLLALRALGDPEAAQEVAQEALARAVAAADRGTRIRDGRLAAFVAGIARHVIADRRAATAREVPLDAAHDLASRAPSALDQLLTAERRREVRQAIVRLSAEDRRILHLSFVEGLGPAEIAAREGEPAERIRKRKSRALDRLRQLLVQPPGHETGPAPTYQVPAPLSPTEEVP